MFLQGQMPRDSFGGESRDLEPFGRFRAHLDRKSATGESRDGNIGSNRLLAIPLHLLGINAKIRWGQPAAHERSGGDQFFLGGGVLDSRPCDVLVLK